MTIGKYGEVIHEEDETKFITDPRLSSRISETIRSTINKLRFSTKSTSSSKKDEEQQLKSRRSKTLYSDSDFISTSQPDNNVHTNTEHNSSRNDKNSSNNNNSNEKTRFKFKDFLTKR